VDEPKIREESDAIVRLTASAICGTDLPMVRGTLSGTEEGTVLGHEGVGIVEEVGNGVRNFRAGAGVVIPLTIVCGVSDAIEAYRSFDAGDPAG
jgi:threonine dehydrogenase-like Zn-dependent dehydrogenase